MRVSIVRSNIIIILIGLLEKDATMISVNTNIIEMILSGEMTFNDFNFQPYIWYDGFIVELLRWFDNKINEISYCDVEDPNWFDNWKNHYEQIVRILYYYVVYKDLNRHRKLVKKVFKYLFSVDDSYINEYNVISSEELMNVYDYIVKNTPRELCFNKILREPIDVLIGRWKTKEMENKLENIMISIIRYDKYSITAYKVQINNYNNKI